MMFCSVSNYRYYYGSQWYELVTTVEELIPLAMLLVPPAIGYLLWRIFVTNRMAPRGDVCVLGLTETSATHSEMYGRGIKWKMLALYACISWLTFNLGLMAFNLYSYVTGLLSAWLE